MSPTATNARKGETSINEDLRDRRAHRPQNVLGMKGAEAAAWVSDCPPAAIQAERHAAEEPMHPMSLLARAYWGDTFGAPSGQR